ncbi:hypothetical protein BLNAU_9963 [Blattamonas nauphoetae]|uniref:Cation-dependent mannose-6-phosphate receptor n=1 Tax=Blattamonas nauphoetae TaxID=2049346 RepID=A0ABQ9XU76_9EUKA|nr:hypothetical protein BLNAU_9963 [Blattamonas nauphoetae]
MFALYLLLQPLSALVHRKQKYNVEDLIKTDGTVYEITRPEELLVFNFMYGANLSKYANCSDQPATSMAVSIVGENQEYCWNNALNTSFTTSDPPEGKGIILTYNSDSGNKFMFKVMCGKEKSDWSANAVGLEYTVSITHPGGCAKGGGGDGFGIAFFIILLASAVLYFAIGIPICKCGMKKSGKEIIPFVNFWIALPGLFVEGVKCMFSPCCKKKGYDAVS